MQVQQHGRPSRRSACVAWPTASSSFWCTPPKPPLLITSTWSPGCAAARTACTSAPRSWKCSASPGSGTAHALYPSSATNVLPQPNPRRLTMQSTLMIKDLPLDQELDGKTMSAVRGGHAFSLVGGNKRRRRRRLCQPDHRRADRADREHDRRQHTPQPEAAHPAELWQRHPDGRAVTLHAEAPPRRDQRAAWGQLHLARVATNGNPGLGPRS